MRLEGILRAEFPSVFHFSMQTLAICIFDRHLAAGRCSPRPSPSCELDPVYGENHDPVSVRRDGELGDEHGRGLE